jgi:hypothetical protein
MVAAAYTLKDKLDWKSPAEVEFAWPAPVFLVHPEG